MRQLSLFDPDEEWRRVPSCEPRNIEVSNLGRVRNGDTGRLFSDKPTIGRDEGYKVIPWAKNGKPSSRYVHHLVAEAWLGPRPEGAEINHIDGNKHNNRADNLEYCTHSQNVKHAWDTGLMRGRCIKTAESEQAIHLFLREGIWQ